MKRNAEQSAACVCLKTLDIDDGSTDIGCVGMQAAPLHVITPQQIQQQHGIKRSIELQNGDNKENGGKIYIRIITLIILRWYMFKPLNYS